VRTGLFKLVFFIWVLDNNGFIVPANFSPQATEGEFVNFRHGHVKVIFSHNIYGYYIPKHQYIEAKYGFDGSL